MDSFKDLLDIVIYHSPGRGRSSTAKAVLGRGFCLALGLAISSVLIAEIYFEQTFDTHFKGADRTYYVMQNVKANDKNEPTEYAHTPGG